MDRNTKQVPWSSAQWVAYYQHNAAHLLSLPWECGHGLAPAEREALAASLQDFQLGESSEGRFLQDRAEAHAHATNDPVYAAAVACFIREEQRHAAVLGQFNRTRKPRPSSQSRCSLRGRPWRG
jgi:hypothetical protein